MLRVESICKTFNAGTVNEKTALNNLSLVMNDGDFATIVGSNGAGKSTLFNAIAGLFYCDEGAIYLDDTDLTYLPEYKRSRIIGRLFQDPMKGTAPHMTIEENLALAYLRSSTDGVKGLFCRMSKANKALFQERLSQLNMGLEDRMKQPVGLLSGGQRQALTLMMATLVAPKLLLLDEHTAALDPATAEKVLEITKTVVQTHNITTLMVTHNMTHALELGNRTLMMDSGKIILDIAGDKRNGLTVDDLLKQFQVGTGKALDNDRILLSD
ncbi:ATP-binding cassette domain-containing protein [Bengtsoniella intestinalis]|uniref:ABC transporter ATP-binding protein n=1 Tax=Bengtsoniella intestinalis TaxID=3073143 RepID=UPI00391F829A